MMMNDLHHILTTQTPTPTTWCSARMAIAQDYREEPRSRRFDIKDVNGHERISSSGRLVICILGRGRGAADRHRVRLHGPLMSRAVRARHDCSHPTAVATTRLSLGCTRAGLVLLLLCCWAPGLMEAQDLRYRQRGNRSEGVRERPRAGNDVELISARVDYTETTRDAPPEFKVRFYLQGSSEVFLTVRELDYRTYYWMDTVRPLQPWRVGFQNVFQWPTRDVIQHLGIEMSQLGVVARIGQPEPSLVERVAPVLFYYSQIPTNIGGYLFTFKTNDDARITASVSKAGDAAVLHSETFRQIRGGRAFTVRWNSTQAGAGAYNLVLEGVLVHTNDKISQTVRFVHQPSLQ
jgi:hypothetical protein